MTIELNNILLRQGSFTLSCDNLSFQKGKVTGIIGRNGSGKSTLLKLINGAYKPEKGKVLLDGTDISTIPDRELSRRMSFVEQEIFDPFAFTVKDVLSVSGYSRDSDEGEMTEALRRCEIEHLQDRKFSELSGGERRLVTLASAIYQDAEIMLLDEPTTFLDVDKELLIHKVLESLKEGGKTIILVMHNISAIHGLADNIIIMGRGNVIDQGGTESVLTEGNLLRAFGVEFEIHDTSSGKAFFGRRPANYK